jgi:hypothetical protein
MEVMIQSFCTPECDRTLGERTALCKVLVARYARPLYAEMKRKYLLSR